MRTSLQLVLLTILLQQQRRSGMAGALACAYFLGVNLFYDDAMKITYPVIG